MEETGNVLFPALWDMIECRKGILRQKYYSVFGNPAPFNEGVRELPRSFKQNVDLLIYLLCYCLKGLIFVNCCRSCHVSRYRPCLQDNHKRSHPLDTAFTSYFFPHAPTRDTLTGSERLHLSAEDLL